MTASLQPQSLPINRIYLAHALTEPAFGASPDEIFYVRTADGQRSIVRQNLVSGLAQALTTEPVPSGGVGYGSGLFAVQGDLLVYAAKGGQLHAVNLATGRQWAITPPFEGVANPAISPCGSMVAFVAEQGGCANVLLADVAGKQLPVKLSEDPWFAFNPTFAPDGSQVAWMEWNENDMPWDESRLIVARLARPTGDCALAAQAVPVTFTRLAQPRVSYASPQFSPNGKFLACTSDESGWRSLWVADALAGDLAAGAVRIDTGAGEIGGPDWVPNLIKMRWNADGSAIYAIRRCTSRSELVRVSWPDKAVTEIETAWTKLTDLNIRGQRLLFTGARPSTPDSIITLDLDSGQEIARVTTGVGLLDTEALVTPEVISWPTAGGQTSWGIFYPGRAPAGETGPLALIVAVHGGPTSEDPLAWDPRAQYFATRGWHYLSVNHRGGTGFGRAYQEMLTGQWGVVDIEDARSGAENLVQRGLADASRLVITGGSAGGYTTLQALARQPEFWTAGVALYAVADLYELRRGSHRFEVNYELGLIGSLPAAGPLWKERSPLTHAAQVRAPLLLLHGRDDKAVPVQQSVDFAEAVRRQGGIAELVIYEGEGHGFQKESTRRDVIERMDAFLDKYVICRQA